MKILPKFDFPDESNTMVLCYEIWATDENGKRRLIISYWDVHSAWKAKLDLKYEFPDSEIIVANGIEHDVTNGKSFKRIDVF